MVKVVRTFQVCIILVVCCLLDAQEEANSKPLADIHSWTFTPLPLVFYTSDTGLGGGALVVAEKGGRDSDDDPRLLQLSATYTQKHQAEISTLFQNEYRSGEYRLQGLGGFFQTPSLFYGVGPEASDEEKYEKWKAEGELVGLKRIWTKLYGGTIFRYSFVRYTEYEDNGAILPYLSGSRKSCRTAGPGIAAQWDSRSSIVFPRSGSFFELRGFWSDSFWGSQETFQKYRVDARTYFSLFSETVLALQGLASYGRGSVPLHEMKELGGNRVLRGYPFSRCIDKSGYALQSELRFPLAGRFGGVAFASCGQVGRSLSDFRISDTRIAAGAGLRVRPNTSSDVNIRLDVAFSPESTGIYITLLEAF